MDLRCLPNALRIEFSRSVLWCSYHKLMRAHTNQSDGGKALTNIYIYTGDVYQG
jgi:hypothetical protein